LDASAYNTGQIKMDSKKMKAFVLKANGGIENLVLSEVNIPEIKPDEVLIKARAISINPVDAFARQNKNTVQAIIKPKSDKEILILGWDVSGTIVEIGSSVKDFDKGNDVFGMVNFSGHGKAYAEYVAAPANQLASKPENISHEEAAGAPLAALTAWQALVSSAKIHKGDKVLIHAAAGGVGHYAVQIAKHFGAYVIGTASAINRDFVKQIGADEFIDYTAEKFEERVKDADIVLESLPGNDHLLRSVKAAKKGGRVISIKSSPEGETVELIREKELFFQRILVRSNGEDMKEISKLLNEGKLHSYISQKYEFKDLPKAHLQIETGKTRGKIVVVL
jgi:NADPH:quinone reductase-like Zn-dependent oxidoreductase